MANNALVLTAPARSNFGIIARPNYSGGVRAFLLHRARKRRHNAGVMAIAHNHELV